MASRLSSLRPYANASRLQALVARRRYASLPKLQPISNTKGFRVIEVPDGYRPPSHPSRVLKNDTPRHFPGPPLSDEELRAQKTKRYPFMMPPKGSRMYRFLTNRMLHMFIAMGVLLGIEFFILLTDFRYQNHYPELLPPASMFWTGQPIAYLKQYLQVYRMHILEDSRIVGDMRAKENDDAMKRKEYLRAHGKYKLMFGWVGEDFEDDVPLQGSVNSGSTPSVGNQTIEAVAEPMAVAKNAQNEIPTKGKSGNETRGKTWFGIW